jgi:hypothetical protein
MRPLALVMTAALLALAGAACETSTVTPGVAQQPSSTAAVGTPGPTPTPSPTSTAEPTPSPAPTLAVGDVPDGDLLDARPTAVCDPTPGQGDPDSGAASIGCGDGLTFALRAVRTMSEAPPERIYLRRPVCAGTPCTDDELNTVDAFVWVGDRVFAMRWDWRMESIARPAVVQGDPWPTSGGSAAPEPARPKLEDAPAEIRDRARLPFCGAAGRFDPPRVGRCFRDAVLDGRPAEMVNTTSSSHGGEIVELYRFEGSGPIHADTQSDGKWFASEGTMQLGITEDAWDFEPFPAAGERP